MSVDESEENKCEDKVTDAFLTKSDQDQRNLSFLKSVVLSPHGHLKKRTEHCFRNLPGLPAAEDLHSKGNVIACCIVPPSNDKKTHSPDRSQKTNIICNDDHSCNGRFLSCQNDVCFLENNLTQGNPEPNHTSFKDISEQSVDDKHKFDHVQEKEPNSGTVFRYIYKLGMISYNVLSFIFILSFLF